MLISEVRTRFAAGGRGHCGHLASTPSPETALGETLVGPWAESCHSHMMRAAGLAVRSLQERDPAYQQRGGVRRNVVPLCEQHPSRQRRGPSPCASAG